MAARPSASAGSRLAEDGGVEALDAAPEPKAAAALAACCGARTWVAAMLGRRPFGTTERLLRRSGECWSLLREEDLLEALEAHPRIGEEVAPASWSAREQAAAQESLAARRELVTANGEYERRFGFRFVVFAEGKSADLILELMRRRLRSERSEELLVATEQARRITRSRLQRLVAR